MKLEFQTLKPFNLNLTIMATSYLWFAHEDGQVCKWDEYTSVFHVVKFKIKEG